MGAWVVEPMHSVVHNLSSVAQAADAELRAAGQRPDKLGDCGDQLRKCFSVSLQAPGGWVGIVRMQEACLASCAVPALCRVLRVLLCVRAVMRLCVHVPALPPHATSSYPCCCPCRCGSC